MNCTRANVVWAAAACAVLAGCNFKPAPPRAPNGTVPEILVVDRSNPAAVEAVTALRAARVNYRYRLEVLRSYYDRVGNADKYQWATDELENLTSAQTFTWANVPDVEPPAGESVADADERLLVEYLVAARNDYLDAVASLVAFYRRAAPQSYVTRRVENLQRRLFPERMYMYFAEAEVPPADRAPTDVIPEADALYEEALRLHRQGKGLIPLFLFTDYGKQRQALLKFRQLIRQYPSSTKIALAAYYVGEIYKEYFDKNLRAVHWYQRAWQWDNDLPLPARFQAAVVWDLRLHNHGRAVPLYKAVIEHEQFNASNVAFAHRRLRQLLKR